MLMGYSFVVDTGSGNPWSGESGDIPSCRIRIHAPWSIVSGLQAARPDIPPAGATEQRMEENRVANLRHNPDRIFSGLGRSNQR